MVKKPNDESIVLTLSKEEEVPKVVEEAVAVVEEKVADDPRPIQLIYVAGKYTETSLARTWLNVMRAVLHGIDIIKLGKTPYIPHLSYMVDQACRHSRVNVPYERWLSMCDDVLTRCDAMYVICDPSTSNGVTHEIELCLSLGIPIFYSLDEVKAAIGV